MGCGRKANLAACFLAAATTWGCVQPSPWNSPSNSGAPVPAMAAAGPAPSGLPQGMPAEAMPLPGQADGGAAMPTADPLGTPPPAAAASAFSGSAMLASWQRAKQSVANSFRIQPQVIPAADPIRLNNQPAHGESVASELHYHAGRVFEAQNSLVAAAAHYRDALARTPRDVRLLTSYARVLDRMGNVSEADAVYRQAIEIEPNNASCHNDLAMCHARHGNLDMALGNLQRAVKLDPANKLYRNNLALVLVDAGRLEDAFGQLAEAHGEAAAHYNLGYMLVERQARDAAVFHFERALTLDPQLAAARQMLQDLQPVPPQVGLNPPAGAPPAAVTVSPTHPSLTRLPRALPMSNVAGGFGNTLR